MEPPSDEKCAIERDRIIKLVKEAGKTLSFEDASKIYVEMFKSDLIQWIDEFTNFGAFLKYGASQDVVVRDNSVSLCSSAASKAGTSSLPVQYL